MLTAMTTNLMVESVEESIAFYTQVLDFTLVDSVKHQEGYLQFAILEKDQCLLMLQERRNLIEELPALANEKLVPCITLYLKITDFNNQYEVLKDTAYMTSALHETFYGTREFSIVDNTGYVLTFAES
ncbi:bleomycin resistance family protein [Enterococcus florum]|uniref:Bleomycin resistance family protein n=1 Tax=Enterococcus florum TaxID=2480627 RepID=A0A4P5PBM7_9ENTE|nr:VOC family protein [Enterococcus florum]GCF92842.1 bleomycin resistance family protein [Enterococcus florum]